MALENNRALLADFNVSRETIQRLEHFSTLFLKWSKSINLVAPSTLGDLWSRHIADSAQLVKLLPQPKQWLDIGSGGGFPGVITAILLNEYQDGWVHLVESNHKKAAFLRVALAETGARGQVHPVRVEDAVVLVPRCDAISARALTELGGLLDYTATWFSANPDCQAFFHKGRDYQQEIEKARGRWRFDVVEHQSEIEADSVILEITNLAPKV